MAYTTQLTPRVQQVLRGIKQHQAGAPPAIQRLPITIDIMHQIKTVLQQQPNSYHNILMWATCCLAFSAFYAAMSSQSLNKEATIQPHTFHTAILQWMTVIIPLWL